MKTKDVFLSVIWGILACGFILYGIMIAAIRSGSKFYIFWFFMAAVCIFFAFAAKIHLWSKLKKPIKITFIALVVIGISAVGIFEAMVISSMNKTGPDNLDYIIVLGAHVKTTGPSVVLKARLDKAIDYMNNNPDTICIVSGGQGVNEPFSEAYGMKDYMTNNNINTDRIIMEDKSTTTMENIEFSKVIIDKHSTKDDYSVGVVTNNFHVFRAMQIANDNGLNNSYGISAHSNPLYLPNNMMREFFGEVKYLICR